VCVCTPGSACACVSMRAHARVCRAVGAGASAPWCWGACVSCSRCCPGVPCSRCWGACVSCCRCWGCCRRWGWGWGWGGAFSLLFTHPQNFNFANPGQPLSLIININIKRYQNHPGGQKILITWDDIGKVRYIYIAHGPEIQASDSLERGTWSRPLLLFEKSVAYHN